MSLHALDQVLKTSQSTGFDRLVLLIIGNFANDWGFADPAIPTIAKQAQISERQVQYCLRRLENRGELHVTPGRGSHPTAGGRQKTNLYQILVGDLQGGAQPAPPSDGGAQRRRQGARRQLSTDNTQGDSLEPKGVHDGTQGGARPAPPEGQGGANSVHPNSIRTSQRVEPNAFRPMSSRRKALLGRATRLMAQGMSLP